MSEDDLKKISTDDMSLITTGAISLMPSERFKVRLLYCFHSCKKKIKSDFYWFLLITLIL